MYTKNISNINQFELLVINRRIEFKTGALMRGQEVLEKMESFFELKREGL